MSRLYEKITGKMESRKPRCMKIERFIRSGKRGTRFYFRVIGGNGEPMAQSEGYNTPRARNNCIKKLQENLAGAEVVDA